MIQRPFCIIVEYVFNVDTTTSPQEALRVLANGGVEIKMVFAGILNLFLSLHGTETIHHHCRICV